MHQKYPIFEPMPGKIVVRLHEEDKIGSLYIPIKAQQSRMMGTIIALGGDEEEGDYYDLQVGDEVIFGQNSGILVQVDREQVLILRTAEILTKVQWEERDG